MVTRRVALARKMEVLFSVDFLFELLHLNWNIVGVS